MKPALNKDVCKHCMATVHTTGGPKDWVDKYGYNKILPWNSLDYNGENAPTPIDDTIPVIQYPNTRPRIDDEAKWQEGKVVCPYWGSEKSIYEIPDWCTFKMEHLLMNESDQTE